ncbi:hypothetical protein WICPIJ_003633 [Wickerhamomyces pijperi]|uniref:Uncharacterized protein n=1 Tax=Wickerhamomyces pijperi TaxID=599730 RepID=A0A9P8Q984_WICPI|nr:hypothetical protein WICPIJ_003633 [Wickerhamomyces pijperi]
MQDPNPNNCASKTLNKATVTLNSSTYPLTMTKSQIFNTISVGKLSENKEINQLKQINSSSTSNLCKCFHNLGKFFAKIIDRSFDVNPMLSNDTDVGLLGPVLVETVGFLAESLFLSYMNPKALMYPLPSLAEDSPND